MPASAPPLARADSCPAPFSYAALSDLLTEALEAAFDRAHGPHDRVVARPLETAAEQPEAQQGEQYEGRPHRDEAWRATAFGKAFAELQRLIEREQGQGRKDDAGCSPTALRGHAQRQGDERQQRRKHDASETAMQLARALVSFLDCAFFI